MKAFSILGFLILVLSQISIGLGVAAFVIASELDEDIARSQQEIHEIAPEIPITELDSPAELQKIKNYIISQQNYQFVGPDYFTAEIVVDQLFRDLEEREQLILGRNIGLGAGAGLFLLSLVFLGIGSKAKKRQRQQMAAAPPTQG